MNTHKSKHIYATGAAHSTTGAKGICADLKRLRAQTKMRSPFRFCSRGFSPPKPVVAALIGAMLGFVTPSSADSGLKTRDSRLDPQSAIRAIVGEAANQGAVGMHAVASAIRNRGTLRGVYGAKNPIADRQPAYVWQRARDAWSRSATNDITFGATHWENVKAFGSPYWSKSMIVTTNIGEHTFYR
jgi:hypothetical protein